MSGRLRIAVLLLVWMAAGLCASALADAPAKHLPPDPAELLAGEDGAVPQRFDGWRLESSAEAPRALVFRFSHRAYGAVRVRLEPRNMGGSAYARTPSFNVLYVTTGEMAQAMQESLRELMDDLVARIRANDKGQFRFAPLPPAGEDKPSDKELVPYGAPDWLTPARWRLIDYAERALSGLFLLAALAGLWFLGPALGNTWREMSAGERRIFLAALGVALLLRLLIPHRLVMAYGGYQLIEQALDLGMLKKYGAGGPLFYHLLLYIVPGQGKGYLWINTIVGSATLPLAALWLRRYMGLGGTAAAMLAVCAVHPLLLRDHNSESNLIPAVFFFFAGLNLWEHFRRSGARRVLVFALASFVFAALCRPFFLIFAPIALIATDLQRRREFAANGWRRLSGLEIGLALGLPLLLLIPHAVFALIFIQAEEAINRAPGFGAIASNAYQILGPKNLFLRPDATPPVFVALALLAFWRAPARVQRRLFALLAIAVAMFLFYLVDSPIPSLPRLQVPNTYFFMTLTAVGALRLFAPGSDLWAKKRDQVLPEGGASRKRPMWAHPGLWLGLWLVSSIWPLSHLWQVTNDVEEQWMLEAAARALPDEPVVLARMSFGDPPDTWGVFRDYPDYLFEPPQREDQLMSLTRWLARFRGQELARPSFVYIGTRCYLLVDEGQIREAGDDYMHPACRRVLNEVQLEPVLTREIVNHPIDQEFLWYPPKDRLPLGLYRAIGMKRNADRQAPPGRL